MVLAADQAGEKNDEISKMIRTLRNSVLLAARHGWREDPTPLPRNMPALMRRELKKLRKQSLYSQAILLRRIFLTGHPSIIPSASPAPHHPHRRAHTHGRREVGGFFKIK